MVDSRLGVSTIGFQYTNTHYNQYGEWISIKAGRLFYSNFGPKETADIIKLEIYHLFLLLKVSQILTGNILIFLNKGQTF